MSEMIPFNKPAIVGRELYYMAQTVVGGHTSGDGPFTRRCRSLMEESFGAGQVLLTTSCTTAMDLFPFLLNLEAGDEVILPSYTFVSTANAFVNRGIKPIFVDVREDTLNINEKQIEAAITPKTRAIVVVHYAGVACDMDAIQAIGHAKGIPVLEDAAQGVAAKYKGRYLGTLGILGAYSFHETKNFICGEGGALVVNDSSLHERAEVLREKGTNRSKFFRGMTDKYTWVDFGTSALSSDILAAFLLAQLEAQSEITSRRRDIYGRYESGLRSLFESGDLLPPTIPAECDSNYHMFFVRTRDLATRTRLLAHLKAENILAVFHYVPLHTSPVGQKFGYRAGDLPVTEAMSERLIRLPFYFDLSKSDQDRVIDEIQRFFIKERRN
jgi:dTDP-4-amino-4,6-dideoxygalactose transaminase